LAHRCRVGGWCLLLTLTVRAIGVAQGPVPGHRLPDVAVAGKTPCEIHPETALETAELWEDARTALTGTLGLAEDHPTLLVQEWRRSLSPNFRLRWERRDTSSVTTLHPFEKPTPASVERDGYIQQHGWTTVFYGPDAGLLLSERFLRRHCFSRLPGAGATAGLVGLAFTPLPTTRTVDVAGILWVDPMGRALRHVEYVWINAPEEIRVQGVGGRTDFARLASGGWIIQRWNIRMPQPMAGLGRMFDGYTDQGGEVLAVGAARRRPD
jgi:hypothetical protein